MIKESDSEMKEGAGAAVIKESDSEMKEGRIRCDQSRWSCDETGKDRNHH